VARTRMPSVFCTCDQRLPISAVSIVISPRSDGTLMMS
jgi:hypothetical protein